MVDFNNDTTISTPSTDIMRVLILEKRTNIIEAMETHNKTGTKDFYSTQIIKSRIQSLYWELAGMLPRGMEKKDIDELVSILFTDKSTYEDLIKVFASLNLFLDKIHLTRIDVKQNLDRKRIERLNQLDEI